MSHYEPHLFHSELPSFGNLSFLRSVMYQLVLHNIGCGLSEKNKSRISQLVRSGSVQLRGSHHILQFSLLIHGRHDAHRALVVHLVLGLGQLSGYSATTPQPRPAPSMRPNNHHPTFNWAERLPHFTKLPKKIPKQHILQVRYILALKLPLIVNIKCNSHVFFHRWKLKAVDCRLHLICSDLSMRNKAACNHDFLHIMNHKRR